MISDADQRWVTEQMGRRPGVPVAVAARCPAGHPCVVSCAPLARSRGRVTPFPTLYWLICPQLSRAVSHLERDGVIAQLERRLAGDAELRARFERDHADYIARRWAMMTEEERRIAEEPKLRGDALLRRGIGGMTSRAAVKCLHLHVAHFLVSGNVIGEIVVREYGVEVCGGAKPQAGKGMRGGSVL